MNPLSRHFRDVFSAPSSGELPTPTPGPVGAQPTLEVAGERRIPSPTDEDIRTAVESLDARTTYAFLILDRDARNSFEVSGDPREGFSLEYYEGKSGRRYSAVGEFTADQTIAMLIAYRDAAPDWRAAVQWEEMDV